MSKWLKRNTWNGTSGNISYTNLDTGLKLLTKRDTISSPWYVQVSLGSATVENTAAVSATIDDAEEIILTMIYPTIVEA